MLKSLSDRAFIRSWKIFSSLIGEKFWKGSFKIQSGAEKFSHWITSWTTWGDPKLGATCASFLIYSIRLDGQETYDLIDPCGKSANTTQEALLAEIRDNLALKLEISWFLALHRPPNPLILVFERLARKMFMFFDELMVRWQATESVWGCLSFRSLKFHNQHVISHQMQSHNQI